jgi:hypothetical protein
MERDEHSYTHAPYHPAFPPPTRSSSAHHRPDSYEQPRDRTSSNPCRSSSAPASAPAAGIKNFKARSAPRTTQRAASSRPAPHWQQQPAPASTGMQLHCHRAGMHPRKTCSKRARRSSNEWPKQSKEPHQAHHPETSRPPTPHPQHAPTATLAALVSVTQGHESPAAGKVAAGLLQQQPPGSSMAPSA